MINRLLLAALVALAPALAGVIVLWDAGGQIVLCQMDFEGSGCLDSRNGDTGSANSGYNCNCSTGNCPLSGSQSGWPTGNGDDSWLDMRTPCPNAATVTIDFKWMWIDNGESTQQLAVGIRSSLGSYLGRLDVKPDVAEARFLCGRTDIVTSSAINITNGIQYHVRFNFTSDGTDTDCEYFVDTNASGDWGVGAVGTGTLNSTDTGLLTDGLFHTEWDTPDDVDSVIDDIGICDATSGFLAAGDKCAPTPTSTPTATPTTAPTSTPTATPTTAPTSTPTINPDVLWAMDFDKSSGTTCTDTYETFTFTPCASNDALTDCDVGDNANCPLLGTYSGFTGPYNGGGAGVNGMEFAEIADSSSDFYMYIDDDNGSATDWWILGVANNNNSYNCAICAEASTNTIYLCNDDLNNNDDSSGTATYTLDTLYRVRLQQIDNAGSNYDCDLIIRTDDNWGSDAAGAALLLDSHATAETYFSGNKTIERMQPASGGDRFDMIWDEIGICDVADVSVGTKCEP